MWLHPKFTKSGIWMGVSYGSLNREQKSLQERLPSLRTPFKEYAFVHQVHGNSVITVQYPGKAGKADALVTSTNGLGLVIQTADCVPIFIIGSKQVAVVHAGWRGVAANIIDATIQKVESIEYAIIGPCISLTNYEVGEEVVSAIAQTGVAEADFVNRRDFDKPHVDLRAAVRSQLYFGGITEIEIFPQCTFNNEDLSSYRRDNKQAGRILSVIGYV